MSRGAFPTEMDGFVRGLPKAELHLHLEGTLEPELYFALARRNGTTPAWESIDALRAARRFADLPSFLSLYYQATSVLQTSDDFRDLTLAYLARAHRDGVRHVEPFFDPQAHTARGVPLPVVVEGIHAALGDGYRRWGITSRLIMCMLRDRGEGDALETWHASAPLRRCLAGVGLDSVERGHPPRNFARLFSEVRAAGLHVVAHAGEDGPPAHVREALDLLHAERIDHGVRAVEDPALLDQLIHERIPLTVCPLSNVALGIVPSMESHPIDRLIGAGAVVTVNSDDPAYFGGYVADNYLAVQRAFGLGREIMVRLARAGFEAAFIAAAERRRLLAEVDAYVTAH